ncbi:hypothetical protein FRC00_004387, partial [Tulasnella sp. 408]
VDGRGDHRDSVRCTQGRRRRRTRLRPNANRHGSNHIQDCAGILGGLIPMEYVCHNVSLASTLDV